MDAGILRPVVSRIFLRPGADGGSVFAAGVQRAGGWQVEHFQGWDEAALFDGVGERLKGQVVQVIRWYAGDELHVAGYRFEAVQIEAQFFLDAGDAAHVRFALAFDAEANIADGVSRAEIVGVVV